MFCGDVWFHGGSRMIRYWMLAFLLIGMTAGVSEARGRSHTVRYQGNSWQSSRPVYYTNGTTQAAYSTNSQSSSQQFVQPASFSSSNNSYAPQGNSMQAWAEEEARMMASRGTCGHIRSAPMGYFVGVGCGTTCMGSGRLVAEASYQGKTVRVWQR
jgi:hypothetical protein